MFTEDYKKANDSITVSEERKAELMKKITAETEIKEKRNLPIFKGIAACLAVLIAAAGIAFYFQKGVDVSTPSTDSSVTSDKVFFNSESFSSSTKTPMFANSSHGNFTRSQLPKFLSAALPVLPSGYLQNKEMFDAAFSEEWKEFFVSSSSENPVSISAERRTTDYQKLFEKLTASKISDADFDVYFIENTEENSLSAYYLTDENILICISAVGIEKSEFADMVKSCISTKAK
mgnify:CR=1 FL=1